MSTPTTETDAFNALHAFPDLPVHQNWKDFARKLEQERDEARKSYATIKEWAHRIEAHLETLLDRCDERADGTVDATPLEKFCNEMIGISNSIQLKELQTLRGERDQLRKVCDEASAIVGSIICCVNADRDRPYSGVKEWITAYNSLPTSKRKETRNENSSPGIVRSPS